MTMIHALDEVQSLLTHYIRVPSLGKTSWFASRIWMLLTSYNALNSIDLGKAIGDPQHPLLLVHPSSPSSSFKAIARLGFSKIEQARKKRECERERRSMESWRVLGLSIGKYLQKGLCSYLNFVIMMGLTPLILLQFVHHHSWPILSWILHIHKFLGPI